MTETFLGNIKGPKGDKGDYADIDSSLSLSSTNPVQNKIITENLNEKANTDHIHDDRYYTETEMDTKLSNKANLSHSHNVSDVTNLQTTLNNKADNSIATYLTDGLMSSSDKTKLDGIDQNANKITIDSSLSTTSTNPVQNKIINDALNNKAPTSHSHDDRYYTETEIDTKVTQIENQINGIVSFQAVQVSNLPQTGENGILYLVPKSGDNNDVHNEYVWVSSTNKFELVGTTQVDLSNYYTQAETNNLLNNKANNTTATTSENGLMSSPDKIKLDGIATGATKITVDSALSTTSTNPVQNKIINNALSGKANSSHTHTKSQITDFSHTHDDRYYTETEIDTALSGKADNSIVTTSTNGLMSNLDKIKLDGITEGATKNTETVTLTFTYDDGTTETITLLKG